VGGHSPFSVHWGRAVLNAPVPLWCVLIIVGVSGVIGGKGYLSWQRNEAFKQRCAPEIRAHDLLLFRRADEFLRDNLLSDFLDKLETDDSYIKFQRRQVDRFRWLFSEVGNQFIDVELSEKLAVLISSLNKLLLFLATHFFYYPTRQPHDNDSQYCLHPNFNVDRDGDGTPEEDAKYEGLAKELDEAVRNVRAAYIEYRSAVKHYLFV
jgi:hypothetical protein